MNTILKPKPLAFIAIVSLSIVGLVGMRAMNSIVSGHSVYSAVGASTSTKLPTRVDIEVKTAMYASTENTQTESPQGETDLADELSVALENPSNDQFDRISRKTRLIARCSKCLEIVKRKFLTRQLSPENTTNLAMALTSDNQLAIADMLLSVAKESIYSFGYDAHSYAIIDALSNFDSPEVAKSFLDYYLNEGLQMDNPKDDELSQTLLHNIRRTSDFEAVGSDIAQAYFSGSEAQKKEVLAINHPQASANIIVGGNDTVEVFQGLTENPDSHVPAAMLTLLKNDAVTQSDISQAAIDWAAKYAGLDAVQSIENLLLEKPLSQTETDLVKSMLLNSPEPQAQVVLEKFETSNF